MCSISVLRDYLTEPHSTARSSPMSLALGLEKREKSATLRCSNTVMLLTASVLVFSANGAMAQMQKTAPPILSSGLQGGATPAATPLIEHLTPGPATQSVFDAPSLPPIESIGAESDIRPFLASGVPEDLTEQLIEIDAPTARLTAILKDLGFVSSSSEATNFSCASRPTCRTTAVSSPPASQRRHEPSRRPGWKKWGSTPRPQTSAWPMPW